MTRRDLLALAAVPPAPLPPLPPYDAMLEDGTLVEMKTSQTGRSRARLQAAAYERLTGRRVHLTERTKP